MTILAEKPLQVWNDLRQQAAIAAQGSSFYHWILSPGTLPRQFAVKMIDPWPGNQDVARQMCKGLFTAGGANIPFAYDLWNEADAFPQWQEILHGFSWLRDLRSLGGDSSRRLARQLVERWIEQNDRWNADIWQPDILGRRIAIWLSNYDFFCGSAGNDFQERLTASLMRQAKHLSRTFPGTLKGLPLLHAAKGLVYAGLSFPDRESWVVQGFDCILKELPKQMLKDGGHVSRSPQQLAEALQIMLDLRCALYRANLPVPGSLQRQIELGGQALRFFRYADRRLALFHGAQEGEADLLDAIQSYIPLGGRPEQTLRESGYEKALLGRSVLILDTGAVPDRPYDKVCHSAPLAFEFAHGRERIFTNCGSHPLNPEWKQVLRHTAAHNALTLNGRPVHDFHEDGTIIRPHARIDSTRVDTKESTLIDAVHNGYARAGIAHRRRFYLSEKGYDLRGEETLSLIRADRHLKSPPRTRRVDIRFHLHPDVVAVLDRDGTAATLELSGGSNWSFKVIGGVLSLENSICFAAGTRPAKTSQLVISGQFQGEPSLFKWGLRKL